MSCIGTAGHVDHGKSTLVKVLTGIDPDRLAEEKERGMTIDLGFAWLKLPGGREVSIVDVPGHESFIKNMLAGVGGIDAALLVVAADEGVMPQTREHLAILDLLHVRRGVVALTKIDLVDEEWLELVREEVQEQLKPTTLANAPIIPVSAYTGQGLPALLTQLEQILDETQERDNIARPRLPIDRVFTMTGFGTVVTGTLLDGSFKLGQEVEVLPQGIKTRIRTLQTHRHQVEVAQPGSRVAMNLVNIPRTDLERGNTVVLPGQLHPTVLIDAHIQLLADAARPLANNTLVDFYSGSQEVPARIRFLDAEELRPGQSVWAQLRLSRPAVVARRDRFILRIPSPSITIGGGEVVDAQPRYHKRFQPSVLNALATLERGSPEELVLAALDRRREQAREDGVEMHPESSLLMSPGSSGASASRPARSSGAKRLRGTSGGRPAVEQEEQRGKKEGIRLAAQSGSRGARSLHGLVGYELPDIVKHSNLSQDVTQQVLQTLLQAGRVRRIGVLWFAQAVWEALAEEAIRLVREHHQQYPLRSGLSKEEWRTRLHLSAKMATDVFAALHAEGLLEPVTGETAPTLNRGVTGGFIRLPGFIPTFTAAQQQLVERLLRQFNQNPYTPPVYAEAESIVGPEVLASLIEQGRLVKLGDGILFLREIHDEAIASLVAYLRHHGRMTAAEARDVLGTTRKYVLPLLEHMDEQHITRRKGDERVLAMELPWRAQGAP